jgi:hypothetical protein
MSSYPDLELDGKVIDDYGTEIQGVPAEELDPANLLFTYGSFTNGTELTSNQLSKLSDKYRNVLYLLIKDDLPDNSPHHLTYQSC